jgi:Flp pilus assembly pilin Flp
MTTAISTLFITVLARLHARVLTATEPRPLRRARGEDGQATTEYALVLLAAALVALLVVAWATAGGGAAKIGRLFDRVIDAVTDRI